MTNTKPSIDIQAGLRYLSDVDSDMAEVIQRLGPPASRSRPGGFSALLKILVGQQVSTASALAIWGRLSAAGMVKPDVILAGTEEDLRALGLSRPKARYAHALATASVESRLDLDSLPGLADEDAHAHLCAMLGIGPWTAEIYLLCCLDRADTLPAGDLALQEAARALKHRELRPKPIELIEIAEPWRPWRGVAALVLWRYYRELVGREA